MFRKLICGAAIAVIALISIAAGGGSEKPASLSLKDMQGTKVKLSDLRGKIVVLNFWATWCGPCNAEMPMLVKASEAYQGKNVAFVGASADAPETQGKVAGYVQKLHIAYPIWIGAMDDDLRRLQMGNVVPATAFVDTDGVVRMRVLGQMQAGEIEQRVDWLLSDRQGMMPAAVVKHLDGK